MEINCLFKEVREDNNEPLQSFEHEQNYKTSCFIPTKFVEATPEEIEKAKKYFETYKTCNIHLVYTLRESYDGFGMNMCGICNKALGIV
jgi:hypothetical protein